MLTVVADALIAECGPELLVYAVDESLLGDAAAGESQSLRKPARNGELVCQVVAGAVKVAQDGALAKWCAGLHVLHPLLEANHL